jgi:hypothetical protein
MSNDSANEPVSSAEFALLKMNANLYSVRAEML